MEQKIAPDAARQNLKDTGCPDGLIQRVVSALEKGQSREMYSLLRSWRNSLLDDIHDAQHRLDRLDYLIRKLGG